MRDELVHVRAHDLVGVDEDDFVEVEREEDVQEEDLVAPDLALLLLLRAQPVRPFVRHERVLEVVVRGQVREGTLEGGGEELFDEPEFHGVRGVPHYGEHHDVEHAFVEMS